MSDFNGSMVTIKGIPICEVGVEYPLSTGPRTFTEADLADAVEAHKNDPSVKDPRLKLNWAAPEATLGHIPGADTWAMGGEPNFGNFTNLRLSEDGQQILADLETLDWLASIMPIVYPSRSIEADINVHRKETGRNYSLVITRVALLGVELPGVSTLDDLRDVMTNPEVTILAEKPQVVVRAQVDADDVRRKFYDRVDAGEYPGWPWLRSIRLDPNEVIFMDEESSQLYRVPFSINDRELEFGEAVAVYEQFVDEPIKDQEPIAAARMILASWSNAADSRMEARVDRKKLLASLGLAEDATDEQMAAKIKELRAAAETSVEPPAGDDASQDDDDDDEDDEPDVDETPDDDGQVTVQNGDGETVVVDRETFAQLTAQAAAGAKAREVQIKARRDGKVQAAVDEGKIPKPRAQHYRKLMDADEVGTTALLASMEKGLIPVDNTEVGLDDGGDEINATATVPYNADWLTPAERARIAAAKAEQGVH